MMLNETITLNNGVEIPRLALGTWLIDDATVADAVKAAARIGYRHVDTAQAYANERGVGEGVRGCGVPRERHQPGGALACNRRRVCGRGQRA